MPRQRDGVRVWYVERLTSGRWLVIQEHKSELDVWRAFKAIQKFFPDREYRIRSVVKR